MNQQSPAILLSLAAALATGMTMAAHARSLEPDDPGRINERDRSVAATLRAGR